MKTKLALFILLLTLLFSFEKGMAQAPAWAWAKSAGGTQSEVGYKTATDASGNVLLTGSFKSNSITFGPTTLTNAGSTTTSDLFIVKYDASGNVLWAKSAGGTESDGSYGIATDASGNILVTGAFKSPSITFGTITLANSGNHDIFIVKYDGLGNVLWAESAGGANTEYGTGISTDASGNVLVTGFFDSDSIIFGTIILTNTTAGGEDIFVLKYDTFGNVMWAKSAGGIMFDEAAGISTDANGNVMVTGSFDSPSITFGAYTLTNTNAGSSDIFIVKYDTSGNVLWAKSVFGAYYDISIAISNDGIGNILVTGYFESASITFGTTTLTNAGNTDIFIAEYDASGNVLWAKSAGGTLSDYGYGIALDASGNVLVAGNFGSPVMTFGTATLTNAGGQDIFILKYNGSGNELWATSAGGNAQDWTHGFSSDAGSGNIFISGSFASPSISFGTTTLTNTGNDDIFIAKLDGTTGIADAPTPLSMTSVFPNPATNYITINTGSNKKQVITISDITGKIIYSTTTLSDKTIINTKDFPQGVYAVQVQAGDAVETRKIVVTR